MSERVSALKEQLRQASSPPCGDDQSTSNPSRPSFGYEFGVVADVARSLAGGYLAHYRSLSAPPSVGYLGRDGLNHENCPDNGVASGKHIHDTYRVIAHFQSTRIGGNENHPDARVCLVKSCKVPAETSSCPVFVVCRPHPVLP